MMVKEAITRVARARARARDRARARAKSINLIGFEFGYH